MWMRITSGSTRRRRGWASWPECLVATLANSYAAARVIPSVRRPACGPRRALDVSRRGHYDISTVYGGFDDEAIVFDDPDHSDEENRFLLLGLSSMARVLVVVHCLRGRDDVIRIISARRATKTECETYARGVS